MTLSEAARLFSFDIPEWIDDGVVVGKITGKPIYAGDVRRLNEALQGEAPHPDAALLLHLCAGRRIEAIKERRYQTGEGLKEAKDYIDKLGIQHDILELRSDGGIGYPVGFVYA